MERIRGGGDEGTEKVAGGAPAVPGWQRAHDELERLAKSRARLDRDEGHWLLVAAREGTHARLGYIHHVVPRADGGGQEEGNLVTLCGAHHRATHRGELVIGQRNNGELRFHHADGSAYGASTVSPALAEARAKAFALRSLGFRQTESKQALERAMNDVPVDATTETLLRRALRELGQTRAA